MSDRIQPNPSGPIPSDDDYSINLRKPPSGVPAWVWAVVAIAVMSIGVLFCGGVAAGLLMHRRAAPSVQPPGPARFNPPDPVPPPDQK